MTQKKLKQFLRYNKRTGQFYWRLARHHNPKGMRAGWKNKNHIYIIINRKCYAAHRLAWLYVHGKWPKEEIDHKDGNGLNNCLSNLRTATRFQQAWNVKVSKRNKSGLKGASQHRNVNRKKRWRSRIRAYGKSFWLGYFKTPQEANDAYASAAKEHHGKFARV